MKVNLDGLSPLKDLRILTLDIESSPNLAQVWDLWNQNVSLAQLLEPSRMLCFGAKWYGRRQVEFYSEHEHGHEAMVEAARDLLHRADIAVHYNGTNFDMRHLRREIILAELPPPSPCKEVDLLRVVRKNFRFASNRLQHVSTELGLPGKAQHEGHMLWRRCLEGDEAAWRRMRKYNIQDVRLTEALYDRLRPWITNHPHVGLLLNEERCCNRCGSKELVLDDTRALTALTTYARYRCADCGGWSRLNNRKANVTMRGIV
jgi:DNA polymerase elongation subunit (family B)